MAGRIKTKSDESRIEMGNDAPRDISLRTLEEKYSEQMRQIFPTKIDLPWLTLKTQIDEQINLRPDFQRRDRWSDEKRSRFIESIVMNVPVPPVFLGEEEYGKYVVLDGRQRLTAAYKFLNNELRLVGLEIWKELNGLTFSEIKNRGFAASIERRFLPAILLTRESSPEVKYEVFDRLNTGGVIATQMEVRNAIFPGEFNALLHDLSKNEHFSAMWGIPDRSDPVNLEKNVTYREMLDLELVLRFFALQDASLKGMKFKDRLSEYMSERNSEYKINRKLKDDDKKKFENAVENCYITFGENAFKLIKDIRKKPNRSAPYYDAVMHAMSQVKRNELTKDVISEIKKEFLHLCLEDKDFRQAVDKGTNGETATRNRINLAKEAVTRALGKVKSTTSSKSNKRTIDTKG